MKTTLLLVLLSNLSFAATSELKEGWYYSNGGLFKNVQIKKWANQLILSGRINYGSGSQSGYGEFSLQLDPAGTSGDYKLYRSRGKMTVPYNGPMTCKYDIDVELRAKETQFYVKSTTQERICVVDCHRCAPDEPTYEIHESPYVKSN